MRRKPNLKNRVEKCASFLIAEPQNLRGRWLEEVTFGEIHVELGCGKGIFTVETAKSNPEILFIALEKITNVLVIALERAEQARLPNVKFINGLAEDLLDFFEAGEVSRIYINFCDPWPANRHAKRRLTGRRFLTLYEQVLKPGGEIHFKTDNSELFEFSLGEFEQCGFVVSETTSDLHQFSPVGVMTDYERNYYEQGMPIFKCVLRNN